MTSIIDKLKEKPNPKKNKIGVKIDIPIAYKPVKINVPIKVVKEELSNTNADDIRNRFMMFKTSRQSNAYEVGPNEMGPNEPMLEEEKSDVDANERLKEKQPIVIIKGKKDKKIRILPLEDDDNDNNDKEKMKTKKSMIADDKIRKTAKPKLKVRSLNGELQDIDVDVDEEEIDSTLVVIDDVPLEKRLPPPQPNIIIRKPSYYQNNRQMFINFINSAFTDYRQDIIDDSKQVSCDSASGDFKELLTHQKIVRDYINIYTPYRGLLLYHGLGSGKTCSSIAIAEGLKHNKQVIIMTPASLQTNYREEIKNCGDPIYKKKQYWEFISIEDNPRYLDSLSKILNLKTTFIKKNKGAWLVNVSKKPNYESLSNIDKNSVNIQIDEMIKSKYKFINYNGLQNRHLQTLTRDYTINPFNDKVIIIDEAHNFVSRIVNKIGKTEKLSMRLYEYLMSAENCKIVLLSGTPIINYPNEIAIFFNILRGYIKTWNLVLDIKTAEKINTDSITKMFKFDKRLNNIVDYIDYKATSKTLSVTKNPFGFINIYDTKDKTDNTFRGIKVNENGDITDSDFQRLIINILSNNNIEVRPTNIKITSYKALPDNLEEFNNYFVNTETGDIKNENLFKRRILGLTSYFRDQDALMPRFNKNTDIVVIKIPMSDKQLGVYEEARKEERKLEKQKKKPKGGEDDKSTSTYRIFSRAFCNFVFPTSIGRPMPNDKNKIGDIKGENLNKLDEDMLDGNILENKLKNVDGLYELDDKAEIEGQLKDVVDSNYDKRIEEALEKLVKGADEFLSKTGLSEYSPKLLNVLENLQDTSYDGLHLLYSQFRTIEGIGVLKLILEHHGYAHFKLKKTPSGDYDVDIRDEDRLKPKFVLYTGTETTEEKEIIRKVFNGAWDDIPSGIKKYITDVIGAENNNMGEVIKLIMITASGAEGISLKNVRFVHILEPYWHPIRMQQVIGRARRICSHNALPEDKQTVNVFVYLMTFSNKNLDNASTELKLHDKSKLDKSKNVTSDELLYEISTIKENINSKILHAIKESSIDCSLHSKEDTGEQLVCYSFGNPKPNGYVYVPSYENNSTDDISDVNKEKIIWKAFTVKIKGKDYALNKGTGEFYDLESYKRAVRNSKLNPTLIGKIIKEGSEIKVKFY